MKLNYDITPLDENQVAGAATINPIVNFLLRMKSQSEYLTINPDGQGSINFDFDAESLLRITNTFIESKIEELDFGFKVRIDDGQVKVSSGHVYTPSGNISISSRSWTAQSGMVYVRLTSMSSGSLQWGSVSQTIQTGGGYRVCFPIATISGGDNNWNVRYHHLGDIELAYTPHVYISGYDKGKIQGLMHEEGSDELVWVEAGPCPTNQGGA